MAIFRDRLPPRRDIIWTFAACCFPIHAWSILNVLRNVPSWQLMMSTREWIGVAAYIQAFALLESIIVLFVFLLFGAVLPARWFRNRFVAQSSIAIFVTSGWALALHFNYGLIRRPDVSTSLQWAILYLASIAAACVLVRRYAKLAAWMSACAERLLVLSFFYVSIDILGIVIIVVRNLSEGI